MFNIYLDDCDANKLYNDHYTSVDNSKHRSYCECGAIISATDGFGEIGHLSALKFSINGSYILPNGIIVLVDEDVEAYFNGTLVFYDRDELPETE